MLNPIPIIAKLIKRYFSFPFSAALERTKQANSNVKTSKLSQVLFLLTATKTGVTARHIAEIRPAAVPKLLLTITYINPTDTTPAIA